MPKRPFLILSSNPPTVQGSSLTTTQWAGPMTPPAMIATPLTTRWPSLQLPYTSHRPAPKDMWVAPFQVAQFLAGLPQFSNLAPTADRFWLLSLITLILAVDHLLLALRQDHIYHHLPPSPTCHISFNLWSEGQLHPPLTKNNMPQVIALG